MATKLCWWDSKNFGDALNPYIFRSFGQKVEYAQSNDADAIAVGSYMERLLVGALFDSPQNEKPILVWGTGFQFEPGRHLWFGKISQPEKFIRPLHVRALRGEISKSRTEEITGRSLPDIALGDPGLLTSRVFDTTGIKKQHRLGIVCHFTDNGNEAFEEIHRNIKDSVRIDVEDHAPEVVNKIASCEAIVSSAMHPLIIADSLRVPNKWINVSDNAISKYKFDDYYSVFNIKPKYFNLNEKLFNEDDLIKLHSEYSITDSQILKIQNKLIESFPFPGKIRYLSIADLFALRLREEFVRDKTIRRSIDKITGKIRRHSPFR